MKLYTKNSKTPKVSVIIPVYNREKFIKTCLNSLVNQTLNSFEIICVDDGSTDNSLAILKSYEQRDKRVRVITQKNAGVSCARNTGIHNAIGEYISFVDSDDWVDADFLEKLYYAAKKYDADIAACGIKRLRSYKWKYHLKIDKEECTEDTNRKFLLCDVPDKCYVWNKIYKLEKIKAYSLFFEAGVYFEDRFFTSEVLCKLKKLVVVPDTYYNYWTNSNSIVKTNSKKKREDSKYTKEKMMNFLKKNNINLDHYFTDIKRVKFLGLTLLKIKYFKCRKEYTLFNCFKFQKVINDTDS